MTDLAIDYDKVDNTTHVTIENINMPFVALVGFLIKITLAVILVGVFTAFILYLFIIPVMSGLPSSLL